MTTQQIYASINNLINQSLGRNDIQVINTQTFVSAGDYLLSSNTSLESFLNTLMVQMYRDVIISRNYRSKLSEMVLGDIEYGAVVRKISTDMIEFEEEESVDLYQKNGQSIDQWTINLPKAHQWLFANRTPKQLKVTIQKLWLREAFRSESEMNSFIGDIFVKIRNKLELGVEQQVKAAMMNYAVRDDITVIPLVTTYNTMSGNSVPVGVQAMFDAEFLNWCTGYIKEISDIFTSMNVKYNVAKLERFTPLKDQRVCILSRFITQLQTRSLYSAFSAQYLSMVNHYTIPYWQAQGSTTTGEDILPFESISTISANGKTITNIIGMIFDRYALGMYRKELESSITPYNAAGGYYNHFWKENQMLINALDEQFALLTLD